MSENKSIQSMLCARVLVPLDVEFTNYHLKKPKKFWLCWIQWHVHTVPHSPANSIVNHRNPCYFSSKQRFMSNSVLVVWCGLECGNLTHVPI